jgi:hypothetical protein
MPIVQMCKNRTRIGLGKKNINKPNSPGFRIKHDMDKTPTGSRAKNKNPRQQLKTLPLMLTRIGKLYRYQYEKYSKGQIITYSACCIASTVRPASYTKTRPQIVLMTLNLASI